MEQVIQLLDMRPEEVFFWRTHEGAELDLFVIKDGRRLGFEVKFSDSPKVTKSMHSALQDLSLDHLYIVYPGQRKIPIRENITFIGLKGALEVFRAK